VDFLNKLISFDKEHIAPKIMKGLKAKVAARDDFTPPIVE